MTWKSVKNVPDLWYYNDIRTQNKLPKISPPCHLVYLSHCINIAHFHRSTQMTTTIQSQNLKSPSFQCVECHQTITPPKGVGTSYAISDKGKVCYDCCAKSDRKYMRNNDRIDLYLKKGNMSGNHQRYQIINWPGTLVFQVNYHKDGKHFIPGYGTVQRIDVWFQFEDQKWHGIQRGDNDICRCRKVKG